MMMKKSRIPLFQREREREKQIGNPTLLETTYDQHHLKKAADLRNGGSRLRPSRLTTHPPPQDSWHRYNQNALTPPGPYGYEVRISAAPTEASAYSQGISNYGHDLYEHPTAQVNAPNPGPSPQISPILEATSPDDRYSERSVSPIDDLFQRPVERVYPRSSAASPQTPVQVQSRFSPDTATPESTFPPRTTAPVQSNFSPASTMSETSRFPSRVPPTKPSFADSPEPPMQSKFSAHSTPRTNYSPQSTFAPVPRYRAPVMAHRPRVPSVADSLATFATKATSATTRKPVPQRTSSPTAPSVLTMATTKELPRPPTTSDPEDRIGVLQAQDFELFVEKSNLTRIIKDLKEPSPQVLMVSDIAKQRETQKQVQELEEKLDQVIYQERDIAMRLRSARKRQEKDNPEAFTQFWVTRVTS